MVGALCDQVLDFIAHSPFGRANIRGKRCAAIEPPRLLLARKGIHQVDFVKTRGVVYGNAGGGPPVSHHWGFLTWVVGWTLHVGTSGVFGGII